MPGKTLTVGKLELRVKEPEPAIWISRIVLLETSTPPKIIRDQPLHRGLNIIWGVGEALQSLSFLLADLACMLLAIEGRATHPRFLIHDSPREADLGLGIYHGFLDAAAQLHAKSGGADAAPFQYIITTTTPPPDGKDHPCMVLKMSAEPKELLFGQVLPDETEEPAEGDGLLDARHS